MYSSKNQKTKQILISMRKIKYLNGFIVLMLAFHVFSIGTNVYLYEISEFGKTLKTNYDQVVFGQATAYIHIALSVLTFIGLIYIKNALSNCIDKGYFNVRSANKFRMAGLFLFFSGGFGLIFDLILFWKSEGEILFGYLGMSFFMLIIAFSLYIIADVIKNGSLMQQDNELTI